MDQIRKLKIKVERCREDVLLPTYKHLHDAGMDVRAAEDVYLAEGDCKIVPLGLKIAIPVGFEIQVRARSGLSLNTPLRLANGVGTVDAGYRDELGVIVYNASPPPAGTKQTAQTEPRPDSQSPLTLEVKGNPKGPYLIRKGERIAQLVLAPIWQIEWEEQASVSEEGDNRGGGYGHSGLH